MAERIPPRNIRATSTLDWEAAQRIAAQLLTIGHPSHAAAIQATANDLVDWCKGLTINGVFIKPEQQANQLVTEARRNWDDWPASGATKQLYALFRRIFGPREPDYGTISRQWEKQYGPPDRDWSEKFIRAATAALSDKRAQFLAQKADMTRQAIEDAVYYVEGKGNLEIEGRSKEQRASQAFWLDALELDKRNHPQEVEEARERLRQEGKL